MAMGKIFVSFPEIREPMKIPTGEMTPKKMMEDRYVESFVLAANNSIPMQKEMTNLWEATAPNMNQTPVASCLKLHPTFIIFQNNTDFQAVMLFRLTFKTHLHTDCHPFHDGME